MKTAVVLSGGGAKGAYQMGVWKALKKMHIKYDIVTGTSVGALNGVLMVQKSYFKAINIWKNITYKDVCGDQFNQSLQTNSDIEVYKQYIKSFFSDGGISAEALDNLFGKNINLNKFKKSKIDYGIVTFNLSTLKPVEMTKKDLLNTSLKNYVLASASCYPAFKPKSIEKQNYIDGGYYDNLPINLAIDLGAERVIAVDLRAPGFKKTVSNKEVEIIRIYPRNKIVSFLVFDKELSRRAINLGYNDTMKTFNKLDGNKYTFKKGHLLKNYKKYRDEMIQVTSLLSSADNLILKGIMNFNDVNSILNGKDFSKLHNNIIEYLGKIYELDESIIYSTNSFNSELLYEFEKIGRIEKLTEKTMLNSKLVIAYIYYLINSNNINPKKIAKMMIIYKKEFMGAIYISALEKK